MQISSGLSTICRKDHSLYVMLALLSKISGPQMYDLYVYLYANTNFITITLQ